MTPEERVRAFVEHHLVVMDDEVRIDAEDDLFARGYVDSPFAIELVCFLERQFGVEISDEELDVSNFSSIRSIVEFLARKRPGENEA